MQLAMNHADKRRILAWLKDLREKHYVEWIYIGTDFFEKTKPAIYYLGINGIRFLRSLDTYPIEEIRKRYKDNSRSQAFIERSMLVTSCYLALKDSPRARTGEASYEWIPEAEYINADHDYRFLAEHEVLRPNLCIVRRDEKQEIVGNYLLEIFDPNLPRYRMRYRLKKYVNYIDDHEWRADDSQPVILLVCPSVTELIYAKRATKKLISDAYTDDDEFLIFFTTTQSLKSSGITAGIWEQGRLLYAI
jgi:hypothetical protein